MLVIIGSLKVVVCVVGGFVMMGRHIEILIQPVEFIIIVGASIGAFLIANPMTVIKACFKATLGLLKPPRHNKASFLELLTLLYAIFKLVQMKGMLALERHVENPNESDLFQQFPKFHADEHAVTFLCDYIRLMTLGSDKAHEMETLMDEEIKTHHNDQLEIAEAANKVAEAMPALGIVTAVLGVIHTMGSISEPPEVLVISLARRWLVRSSACCCHVALLAHGIGTEGPHKHRFQILCLHESRPHGLYAGLRTGC